VEGYSGGELCDAIDEAWYAAAADSKSSPPSAGTGISQESGPLGNAASEIQSPREISRLKAATTMAPFSRTRRKTEKNRE